MVNGESCCFLIKVVALSFMVSSLWELRVASNSLDSFPPMDYSGITPFLLQVNELGCWFFYGKWNGFLSVVPLATCF